MLIKRAIQTIKLKKWASIHKAALVLVTILTLTIAAMSLFVSKREATNQAQFAKLQVLEDAARQAEEEGDSKAADQLMAEAEKIRLALVHEELERAGRIGSSQEANRGRDPGREQIIANAAKKLVAKGDSYLDLEAWIPARDAFREAVVLDPDSYEAHEGLILALLKTEAPDEALDAIENAEHLFATPRRLHIFRGRAHELKGEFGKAGEEFELALEGDPEDPNLLSSLAHSRLMVGDFVGAQQLATKALTAFDKSESLDPLHVPSFVNLGVALVKVGLLEQGLRSLDMALRMGISQRDRVVVLSNKAEALIALDRGDEAKNAAIDALSLDPGNVPATINLATAEAALGDYSNAQSRLTRLKQNERLLDHEYRAMTHTLSGIMVNQGKNAEAIVELEALIDSFPDDANAHALLGAAYHSDGLNQRARKHYERVVELDPDNASNWFNKAWLHCELGEYLFAFRAVLQVVRIEPSYVTEISSSPVFRPLLEHSEYGIQLANVLDR